MYSDLELVLSTKIMPERIALFVSAATILDGVGSDGHRLALQELIHTAEDRDPLILPDEVEGILRSYLDSVLINHGVKTVQDAPLGRLVDVLDGLLRLPSYEDIDALQAICEDSADSEATLADLLELVSTASSDDFLLVLEEVSPRLIERLLAILETQVEVVEQQEELNREELCEESIDRQTIRQRLLCYIDNKTFIISEAIQGGLPLGMKAEHLLERFDAELEVLDMRRAVEELVAILMASCVTTDAVFDLAGEYLEALYEDPRRIMEAKELLNTVRMEYGRHAEA